MDELMHGRAVNKRNEEDKYTVDKAAYETLEQRGFKTSFIPRHRNGGLEARWDRYIGKKFRVIARAMPMNGDPMWIVEFEDGFRMAINRWEALK